MSYDIDKFMSYRQPRPQVLTYPDGHEIGDALGKYAEMSQRDKEFDANKSLQERQLAERADERRVTEGQTARHMLMGNRNEQARIGIQSQEAARRESQAQFERQHMLQQEDEKLFHDFLNAPNPWAAEAIAQELERRGYKVRRPDAQLPGATAPAAQGAAAPSYDETAGGTLLPKASDGPGMAPPKPRAADARTGSELDAIDKKYMGGLVKGRGQSSDAGATPPPLPGARQAAPEDPDAIPAWQLSDDDPYQRLR